MATREEIQGVKATRQAKLLKKKNVVGVGIGYKESGGQKTDRLSLIVMVEKKVGIEQLDKKDIVPQEVNGIITDVKEVGKIVALKSRTDRWRPAPGGVSIGHLYITAGTFGAPVRDATSGELLILSNNHVLANSNDANVGDSILQPGPADGGNHPQDRIADLKRFIPIRFESGDDSDCSFAKAAAQVANLFAKLLGSRHRLRALKIQVEPNEVDAAVAKPVAGDVIKDEILDIGRVSETRTPEVGLAVTKSGRTTAITSGSIDVLDASVTVGYGGGNTALFENQILTGDMSDPGDSGSLLVDAETHRAVGLLFAGSDQVTVYNPIGRVTELLGIRFGE
jgi:hypothetical protein